MRKISQSFRQNLAVLPPSFNKDGKNVVKMGLVVWGESKSRPPCQRGKGTRAKRLFQGGLAGSDIKVPPQL